MLSSIDKSTIYTYAESLFSTIYSSAKESIGLKQVGSAIKPCEYPQTIISELALKRRLEKKWKSEMSSFSSTHPPNSSYPQVIKDSEAAFVEQRKKVSKSIFAFRAEKRKEEIDLCSGNTSKSKKRFWSHVTSKKVKGSSDIPAVRSPITGDLVTDP